MNIRRSGTLVLAFGGSIVLGSAAQYTVVPGTGSEQLLFSFGTYVAVISVTIAVLLGAAVSLERRDLVRNDVQFAGLAGVAGFLGTLATATLDVVSDASSIPEIATSLPTLFTHGIFVGFACLAGLSIGPRLDGTVVSGRSNGDEGFTTDASHLPTPIWIVVLTIVTLVALRFSFGFGYDTSMNGLEIFARSSFSLLTLLFFGPLLSFGVVYLLAGLIETVDIRNFLSGFLVSGAVAIYVHFFAQFGGQPALPDRSWQLYQLQDHFLTFVFVVLGGLVGLAMGIDRE